MIEIDEFVDRLGRLGSRRGPRRFPRRRRAREILMKSIALTLDSAREYSERPVTGAARKASETESDQPLRRRAEALARPAEGLVDLSEHAGALLGKATVHVEKIAHVIREQFGRTREL